MGGIPGVYKGYIGLDRDYIRAYIVEEKMETTTIEEVYTSSCIFPSMAPPRLSTKPYILSP